MADVPAICLAGQICRPQLCLKLGWNNDVVGYGLHRAGFRGLRYRDLPVGRALHDLLIARPADWLVRTPPRRVFIIVVLLIGASLVWVEIAPLLAAADLAPALWFADMSLYLDAVLMVGVASAAVRVRSIGRVLSNSLRQVGHFRHFRDHHRMRAASPSRPKRPSAANEGEPDSAIRRAA